MPIVREHGARLPALSRSAAASAMKAAADDSTGHVAAPTRALPFAYDAIPDSGKTSRRGHNAKTGALIGGGIGVGLSVIAIGAQASSDQSESPNEGINVVLGSVAATAILAIIGAGIGWLIP